MLLKAVVMATVNWILPLVLFILLFCSTPCGLFGQGRDRLVKLSEDVYARIASPNGNAVGNSGFILLGNSVLVFDTHYTPEAGNELLNEIRSVSDKPVRYVVNSHFHPDHTHGNQAFTGTHLISNYGTRKDILEKDLPALNRAIRVATDKLEKLQKQAENEKNPVRLDSLHRQMKTDEDYLAPLVKLKISAPFVVLEDFFIIQDGSKEVRIQFLGSGHTDHDIILVLPSEKIAFLGDLFFNQAIPNVRDAEVLQWMETLGKILELDAELFVPGHGPPGNRQDVMKFLTYFEDLRALVEPFVIQGKSVELTMQEIQLPIKYSRYKFKNLFPANIQKMYAELKMLQLLSIPVEGPQRPEERF
jgi:cyclase